MFAVDVHTHTRFFHGFPARPTPFDPVGARALAAMARRRDLDGVAVTNHDYCWHDFESSRVIVPGIEISTTRGHVLVVGPSPPSATTPGELTPREVVSMAHDADCAVIMPHPFRNSALPESDVAAAASTALTAVSTPAVRDQR